jgi:hypothetical protein
MAASSRLVRSSPPLKPSDWLIESRCVPPLHKIGKITKIKKSSGRIAKGILTPSFIEIAPAVTKCALLTDECLGVKFLLTDECLGVKFGQFRPCITSAVWNTQQNINNSITPLILTGSSPNLYHMGRHNISYDFSILPWKVGRMRHVYYMWCIPTKYAYSKNLVMLALIVTSEMALVCFWLMPPGGHTWSPIGPKFSIHIVAA